MAPRVHGHVHRHDWVGGERVFAHAHPYPVDEHDPLAARPHQHAPGLPHRNPTGRHSHPHGHGLYQ